MSHHLVYYQLVYGIGLSKVGLTVEAVIFLDRGEAQGRVAIAHQLAEATQNERGGK